MDTRKGVRRGQPSPNDVFALVKQVMHDECLSQPPLLVFPNEYTRSAHNVFDRMNVTAGVAFASEVVAPTYFDTCLLRLAASVFLSFCFCFCLSLHASFADPLRRHTRWLPCREACGADEIAGGLADVPAVWGGRGVPEAAGGGEGWRC